ncbi:hypothetical protein [Sulfurospirillum oryzae]|uniref:hypothetical protein n=1 Tax=Sulfurospirillum oryzae TaxID=2976535 RepID=UPI0021E9351B|nr:hypothetical protein [Sulfurospirillum oryzae]
MIHKGLSHYQSVQKSVKELDNSHILEKIMEKAAIYDIVFLQNRSLMETIVNSPEKKVDEQVILHIEKLLLWLVQTQEEAKLS